MNRLQRDSALLQEAGVSLDRALFPAADRNRAQRPCWSSRIGRAGWQDYTTVSRQITKLDGRGLIQRRPSNADNRVRKAVITEKGKVMTSAIDAAIERMASVLFATWSKRDLQDLARLMRRFADDLHSLPIRGES